MKKFSILILFNLVLFFSSGCMHSCSGGSSLILENNSNKNISIVLNTTGFIDTKVIEISLAPLEKRIFSHEDLFCDLSFKEGEETYYYLVAYYRDNNIDKVTTSQLFEIGPKVTSYKIFKENDKGELEINSETK